MVFGPRIGAPAGAIEGAVLALPSLGLAFPPAKGGPDGRFWSKRTKHGHRVWCAGTRLGWADLSMLSARTRMRAGLTIQERTCPWCQNKRTIRMCGELSICFNCNHRWRGASPLEKRARALSGDEPLVGLTF